MRKTLKILALDTASEMLALGAGVVDGGAQGAGGEGGAGNAVHAGAVGFDHIRNHDVEDHIAHMGGFGGIHHLDARQRGFGEGDLKGAVAVIAFAANLVVACRKGQRRGSIRHFAPGFRQSLAHRFHDPVGGHGRAGNGVKLSVILAYQGFNHGGEGRYAEGLLQIAGNLNRGDLFLIHGHSDRHGIGAGVARPGSRIRPRGKRALRGGNHAAAQQQGKN